MNIAIDPGVTVGENGIIGMGPLCRMVFFPYCLLGISLLA